MIISGWQATGITTFSMGQFQTATLSVDWLTSGQRVHLKGNADSRTIEQPGINNWDIGVVKNTRFKERFNAQFRWELFNTGNHTQLGTANLSVTSANFGKIMGVLDSPRRMQFGLRLSFWRSLPVPDA
jgi:hypothetical protein